MEKIMTNKEIEVLAKELVPLLAESKAMEVFSMTEEEALSYGAFEETALLPQEKENIFDEYLEDFFIKSEGGR